MTARTFTAAEFLAMADRLEFANDQNMIAMLRQGAEALERWEQLKAEHQKQKPTGMWGEIVEVGEAWKWWDDLIARLEQGRTA